MKFIFIQKNSLLFLLGAIVIVSATLIYLSLGDSLLPFQQSPIPAACKSSAQHGFQRGITFPEWSTLAYGSYDTEWQTELPDMRTQTDACWVEIPILFYQSSLTSTTVTQGPSTPTLSSFTYGMRFAHAQGFHIFVTPLITVNGAEPWSGAIHFSTAEQEQQWFDGYWATIEPYVAAAAQAGVDQLAIGSEYEWLQNFAPAALWNELIARVRSVFPRTLTYDMNWNSLNELPAQWMRNPDLHIIGISEYLALTDSPVRIDPQSIPSLWKNTIKRPLDLFARELGKPVLLSEIGYRNSSDTLYHPWEPTSSAAPDPQEQAAACDAALSNIIGDPYIIGTFFWGWDNTQAYTLKGHQAANVIHRYYASL